MLQQFLSTIEQYRMLSPGDKVIAAVSGGADSVAMCHLLKTAAPAMNLQLHLAHVDHMLRGEESRADAEFAARLAQADNIPYTIERIDVRSYAKQHKLGLQEAARLLRYQFLEGLAKEIRAQRIAVAHTADDQAETVLLWLIRGCGPEGLQGIPPVRQPYIVRPMIHISRRQIEEYIKSRQLAYRQDASNLSPKYRRNRIRLEILPQLEQLNPNIRQALGQLAQLAYSENEFWQEYCEKRWLEIADFQDSHYISLKLAPLRELPEAALRRMLRFALRRLISGDLPRISYRNIEAICGIIHADRGQKGLNLPHNIRVVKSYQTIELTVASPTPAGLNYDYPLNVPGETRIPELNLVIKASLIDRSELRNFPSGNAAALDWAQVKYPLRVRNRKPGDRFQPLGAPGSKKLKDFLIDAKVPLAQRSNIPIVVCGEDIVWVMGYQISERYKVNQDSKKILHLQTSLSPRGEG